MSIGSSVKYHGGYGLHVGRAQLNNGTILDEPMKFQGSAEKSSVFNRTGQSC